MLRASTFKANNLFGTYTHYEVITNLGALTTGKVSYRCTTSRLYGLATVLTAHC